MSNIYKNITFSKAINIAIEQAMYKDENVVCFGLGVTDPKGVFNTTLDLEKKFGINRVFDMPTSENAMTGIAIGMSMNGFKPLMTHQRLDFFLLAMDQLVNSASKWHYMFGSKISIPITIRLIIGRGWGQGPTHSQNLQSWFAHIPGLKVVMPTSPEDAKGLLLSSIFDPNPVIFLEHRWLHNTIGNVPKELEISEIGHAKLLREGKDITIISMSYMTIEAVHSCNFLEKYTILCDLIDLRSIKPIDWNLIFESVSKTGRVIVLDTGHKTCSVSSEIITRIVENIFEKLKKPPERLTIPDIPEPTSFGLTRNFHKRANDIAKVCSKLMDRNIDKQIIDELPIPELHDVPGDWFKGPF
tara:strand:+ start:829 stop:1899 length:1071 start_codon:yes stop_codon:yes gene_type:complete